MKFQRIRDFAMGAVTASLILGVAPAAFAKVASMEIPVQYNNVKVLVDGKELRTEKEPFLYEGTTYLPLRAVAEAVGREVSWDPATKTAMLSGGAAAPGEGEDEPAKEETGWKTDRWIRVTNKTSAQGDSVEIKCTDIRENPDSGMLELDFKLDNTGFTNYEIWIDKLEINGKRMPVRDEMFAYAYSDRKTEETLKLRLSDLDAADIGKIYNVNVTFYGFNVDGGRGFRTNEMSIQFKS